MDQPQSSNGSKSLRGLKTKNYSGDVGFNFTAGEQGKDTVGAELNNVDIDGKLVNITRGTTDSNTTGLNCSEDMHVGDLMNVTGPSTLRMEDVTPWLSLLGHQAGAPSQQRKVKSQPTKINDHTDVDDIINRIEEKMANKYSEYDLPLQEFFRPLPKLCATTGDGINRLMYRLQAMGQLDDETVGELEAMPTNEKRCRKVYEIVAQKEAVRPLFLALEQTNNKHVIQLLASWL